ncbi:hypothetical protein C0V70_15380 [Bacteriovorax stolpii]|uniref:Uracil-DNA glycosylase-like domain-containing protein n=2 Tax=Bacteriovorax stolpii TaxID=960 RepID=A0A2K9NXG2_BACTC|nr:hypothetical protein C0V70_15380 [Bacteriovorax stolpii]
MQALLFSVTNSFSDLFLRVFTPGFKNGNLGIILLMDQQFKKIIQKTKALKEDLDPLAKTFEGALFKDSSWVFSFDESVQVESAPAPVVAAAAPVKKEVQERPKTGALSLVLFVGDTYAEGKGEDLLGKMIQAMKLKPGEFNRIQFDEKLDDINDLAGNLTTPSAETTNLIEQIEKFKPEIVVSLGATVTNILLGKREKLSGIHGQFFDKSAGSYHYNLMPLFHPDFLVINPNMKRTAWIDLQKVMERVGKI